jgi:hypothetical protein
MSAPHRHVLRDMLAQAQMPPDEVERRATLARDAGYWRRLYPSFGVDGQSTLRSRSIAPAVVEDAIRRHRSEEFFTLPPLLDFDSLAALNGAVDTIVAEGWPAAFAFVYDEFWNLARLPAMKRLFGAALGDGYHQIPHVWIHIVPPVDGGRGWGPHVDGDHDGRTSAWFALTDATPDNGCMYLIPRAEAPDGFATSETPLGSTAVRKVLHGVHALPTPAGGVVGWSFKTLHWGGSARHGASERRAVSLEFLAPGHQAYDDEVPLVSADRAPAFAERVAAIATGLAEYRKFEPGLVRYQALAERLLQSRA